MSFFRLAPLGGDQYALILKPWKPPRKGSLFASTATISLAPAVGIVAVCPQLSCAFGAAMNYRFDPVKAMQEQTTGDEDREPVEA